MFQGLRTFALYVDDVAAARDWYAKILGKAPYFDEPFYVGFEVAGFELGIVPREGEEHGGLGSTVTYWGVPDVAAAQARMLEAGATLEDDHQDVGGDIVTGTVIDPFGNRIGLIYNPHFKG